MPVAPPDVAAWFVPHHKPTESPAFNSKVTSEYPHINVGTPALLRAAMVKTVEEFAMSAADVLPFTRNQTTASWATLSSLAN